MAKNKGKDPNNEERSFLVRKSTPILVSLGLAFLLFAVGLPIAAVFHWTTALILFSIAGSLTLAFAIVFVLYLLSHFGNEVERMFHLMSEQLEDFSHGDIKLSSVQHFLPFGQRLQEQLNKAISRYSQYRLVYTSQSSDSDLNDKIAAGTLFSFPEFQEHLYKEVQNNLSFRSALLFIQAMGSDPIPEKALTALHQKILAAFPGAIVGKYDDKTFVVYDYSVDSFLSLRTLAERFVTDFNQFSLSSFDDVSLVNYCRIGGVVYPYVPLTNLVQDGLAALNEAKDVFINTGSRSVYYPHAVLSETNKRVIYLASMEAFQSQYYQAKTFAEQLGVLKDFVRWFAVISDFEVGGIMVYSSKTDDYEIILETGKEKSQRSFSLLGERIPASQIDRFYSESVDDLSFSAANVDEVPTVMANYLANIGIRSFFFAAVVFEDEKKGLLYFTSSKQKPFFPLITRENLNSYVAIVSSLVTQLQADHEKQQYSDLLEALASRSNKYLYTIDRKTHKLTYLSENLSHAFPNAKVGEVCYEALRTAHTAPCSGCPLDHGVDRRIIGHISNTESTLSVLQFRSVENDCSSILIEGTSSDDPSSSPDSRFKDDMLLIKNATALTLELSRQIKLGAIGYIVSLKLLESDSMLSKLPGADANSIMAGVVKTLQDAGYGDILYRYDTFELAFLLKSYTKTKITDFVEEIADQLAGTLEVRDVAFSPKYAFSAISYPNDANNSKMLLSLIQSELNRSEGFGSGYLLEVADSHPRKALRDDYVLSVLEGTLAKDEMPIMIHPILDTKSGKPIGGEILARLYGPDGIAIAPADFIPLSRSHQLVSKIDICALRAAGMLYENYAYTIFKTVGLANLHVHLAKETLKDLSVVEQVKRVFARYRFPKNYVVFEVSCDLIRDNEADMMRLINGLRDLGVVFQAVDYAPETIALDTLRKLGISQLRTDKSLIVQAISTPNDYAAFFRFVDSALRGGFLLTCAGIENAEEYDLAKHLDIPSAQGYYFAHPLLEKDFIKYLNYGN